MHPILSSALRDNAGQRIISISGAPYDGYSFPHMLESLKKIGATHVEPAFIVGYTEPFDESTFTEKNATEYANWLKEFGIGCFAFSSHIDLGREDAIEVFLGRMDFARRIGARVINTNASARATEKRFFENIAVLARHAEQLDMLIGLENPGDGSDNLLNTAADAAGLLARINHPRIGLNYDAGNTISHRPDVDSTQDALEAMQHCLHTHIKNVQVRPEGYFFSPLDAGVADCAAIVQAVRPTNLSLSIEMPLRLHRKPDSKPNRSSERVPLETIEGALKTAMQFVSQQLTPSSH